MKLSDACASMSSNIAQKDISDCKGEYPIFGASGLIGNVDFYKQEKPYIGIVKDGAGVGRAYLLPGKSSVIGTMQYIIPKSNADITYLYYAIQFMHLEKYYNGATIPHIYFRDYKHEPLILPELPEQQEKAQVLATIDKLISLHKMQVEMVDKLVKSRFVEMFFNTIDRIKWEKAKIEDICENTRTGPFGSSLHHDEFVDEGIFVLGIDNAVENRFSYNRMRYITPEKYEQLKRYTVKPKDVIITIMGTVGRSAVIPDDMPTAINTKHLACLTPKQEIVDSYFLAQAFQTHPEIRGQLTAQTKGAIMDGLNLTIIKNLTITVPPLSLQKEYVTFLKQADKSKLAIQQSIDTLQTLKAKLMQDYFGRK